MIAAGLSDPDTSALMHIMRTLLSNNAPARLVARSPVLIA